MRAEGADWRKTSCDVVMFRTAISLNLEVLFYYDLSVTLSSLIASVL